MQKTLNPLPPRGRSRWLTFGSKQRFAIASSQHECSSAIVNLRARLSAASAGTTSAVATKDFLTLHSRRKHGETMKQRVELSGAIDLWRSQVLAEQDPLESIRAEFARPDADIETKGALQHARATIILAALGEKVTEQSYLRVLGVLDSEAARHADTSELDEHLENARLLSDAAEASLYKRGVSRDDVAYESAYVAEVTALSRQYGLPHGRGA
jgi:hypothetical protein